MIREKSESRIEYMHARTLRVLDFSRFVDVLSNEYLPIRHSNPRAVATRYEHVQALQRIILPGSD